MAVVVAVEKMLRSSPGFTGENGQLTVAYGMGTNQNCAVLLLPSATGPAPSALTRPSWASKGTEGYISPLEFESGFDEDSHRQNQEGSPLFLMKLELCLRLSVQLRGQFVPERADLVECRYAT